jgi:hypothetical protein
VTSEPTPVRERATAVPVRRSAPPQKVNRREHSVAQHIERDVRASEKRAPVAVPTVSLERPRAAPAQLGSTHVAAVEGKLPQEIALPSATARENAVSVPAPRADEPAPAPAPAQGKETPAPGAIARIEEAVTLPARRKEETAPAVTPWLRRLRSELAACGQPGVLLNDLCREAARWKYCYAGRWDTVRECAVQRFAGVSN